MMATPELSSEELEIAEDGDDFTKKGALGIISLNLFGSRNEASFISPKNVASNTAFLLVNTSILIKK